MSEEQQNDLPEDTLIEELKKIRDLVSGRGCPSNLINDGEFPNLEDFSPEVLEYFRTEATVNFAIDQEVVSMKETYGLLWNISSDEGRALLYWGKRLGMEEQAIQALEKSNKERIENLLGNGKGIGFK